ncbi:hypothetical protein [Streptomyces sp. R33]|uniref:Transposase n=1 Tax=Streptomyces sp. R33 TaxID=3238629 RepID=A0AB39YI89_9ACTN
MPVPAWLEGRGGQPESYCHRQLVDAVRYLVAGGIAWRAAPCRTSPHGTASTPSSGAGGTRAWSPSSTTGCAAGSAKRRAVIRSRPPGASTRSR